MLAIRCLCSIHLLPALISRPLLAMAELTPERLQAIYHDGLGVTAALALLDEAGVRELNEKIRLLDALTQVGAVAGCAVTGWVM